ncbi:MAG: Fe-S cluster protein, partial [bacterium]|nr:Fe-S cluster protein [bacterium]
MGDITTAAAIMLGLALFFAGILVVAYRFFRVDEDPR